MNWYFAAGDLDFFWPEQLRALSWLPRVFYPDQGFGYTGLLSLWLDYPFRVFIKLLSTAGLSWFVIEKLLWFSVFALAVYSAKKLADYVLGKSPFTWVAPAIYATNTYILLLFGGGQLGVALAYGLSPLVLLKFMQAVDELRVASYGLKQGIQNGLLLALLITFDLRIAYLTVVSVVLYSLLRVVGNIILQTFVVPILVAVSVHAFWILPTVLASAGVASKGAQYTDPAALSFFSFADFSHALSLLHPNWPENLFGRAYFLQPEFLIIPILAFSSLLFIAIKKLRVTNDGLHMKYPQPATRNHITYFAFLSLVGAFLAKGVQEPFGGIFQWMFVHVPGFVMFRDPTKFYIYSAIGYSILIPFALFRLSNWLKNFRHKPLIVYCLLSIVFIAFWLFTVRPVFLGGMSGNFRPLVLTDEYVRLKDALVGDLRPSRVLWLPKKDAFAYASGEHPLLTSEQLFGSASVSGIIALTKQEEFAARIRDAGVGYVVVPQDLEKRIFLDNYRFDPDQRQQLINALDAASLSRDRRFGSLAVYRNDNFTMITDIPPVVSRQQNLANTGLVISIISLVFFGWTISNKQET